jgi:hypothetical protein
MAATSDRAEYSSVSVPPIPTAAAGVTNPQKYRLLRLRFGIHRIGLGVRIAIDVLTQGHLQLQSRYQVLLNEHIESNMDFGQLLPVGIDKQNGQGV